MILPFTVFEELDRKKMCKNQIAAEKAANAIRKLNKILSNHPQWLKTENSQLQLLPPDLDKTNPDNKLLSIAINHQQENVFLLTNDKNLANKAMLLDVKTINGVTFIADRS